MDKVFVILLTLISLNAICTMIDPEIGELSYSAGQQCIYANQTDPNQR